MNIRKKYLVKPISQDDAEAKLLEATNILKQLRNATVLWQTHYGSHYKDLMKRWEEKADFFLDVNIVQDE